MEVNKIYNMDCMLGLDEMIRDGNKVDCVLTSPPYNTSDSKGKLSDHTSRYDVYQDECMSNEEYYAWTVELFNKFDKVLNKDGKILYNMSYGTENTECMSICIAEILRKTNFTLADIIVWEKKNAIPNNVSPNKLTRICEFVYVFCRRSEFDTFTTNKKLLSVGNNGQNIYANNFNKIVAKNNDGSNDMNKATYSVELCMKLMDFYCQNGNVVLDPFMGTGTTAVACRMRGELDYIGFELSPNQCEYANMRIKNSGNTFFDKLKNEKQEDKFLDLFEGQE